MYPTNYGASSRTHTQCQSVRVLVRFSNPIESNTTSDNGMASLYRTRRERVSVAVSAQHGPAPEQSDGVGGANPVAENVNVLGGSVHQDIRKASRRP